MSGVTVPTMIRSMSSGVSPARSMAQHRRFLRQIGRRDAWIDDMALADSGALQDPVVGGIDEPLQIGIGEQARRHIGRQTLDLCPQNNPLPGMVRLKYS